ncbi:MAG: hypothetical protein AB3N21_01125 [Ruegeria sp.]|uniref:hypothetical protein n=1 Tax=Ruegeria sp. TaxID=1879320 RepID=UPI00349E4BBE
MAQVDTEFDTPTNQPSIRAGTVMRLMLLLMCGAMMGLVVLSLPSVRLQISSLAGFSTTTEAPTAAMIAEAPAVEVSVADVVSSEAPADSKASAITLNWDLSPDFGGDSASDPEIQVSQNTNTKVTIRHGVTVIGD